MLGYDVIYGADALPDGPTRQQLDEALSALSREAPLERKIDHLLRALEISDHLDAIASSDVRGGGPEFRIAAVAALKATLAFIKSIGSSSASLGRLMNVLCECDEGHVHPLIAPPKISHRKPDSDLVQARKAMAAAAMHLFMDDGLSKERAAHKVEIGLKKTSFRKYGGKPIGADTIATWRDRYTGFPNEADAFAVSIFEKALVQARAKFSMPTEQAQSVLDAIARAKI